MKQSICEYFQRENEFFAIGETMRRDPISGGFGDGATIDRAVAAIATACGSWA